MKFGNYLRDTRRERQMSQRALAQSAGVDVSYISKLENERLAHTPSVKTLGQMAQALGADELEFLRAAGKLPTALDVLVEPQAMRVMRAAEQRIPDSAGWEALLDYVESDDFERAAELARDRERWR